MAASSNCTVILEVSLASLELKGRPKRCGSNDRRKCQGPGRQDNAEACK